MSDKKVYKTTLVVTILSEHSPENIEHFSLADVDEWIDTGDAIGNFKLTKCDLITDKKTIQKELLALGNDGSFFDSLDPFE
jgi:hypothetical protein